MPTLRRRMCGLVRDGDGRRGVIHGRANFVHALMTLENEVEDEIGGGFYF